MRRESVYHYQSDLLRQIAERVAIAVDNALAYRKSIV